MKVSSIGNYNVGFSAAVAKKITSEDINRYYNAQIRPLEIQRDSLLQLDSFMDSDFVKNCMKKLPKEDELYIDCRNLDINDTHLLYNPANKKSMAKFESIPVDDAMEKVLHKTELKNGQLDVDGIAKWLSNLVDFLGK